MANSNSADVILNFKPNGAVEMAKTIKDLNTVMNTAAKEFRATVAAMDSNSSASDKLAASQKKLETQLSAAEQRTKLVRQQFEDMAKDTDTSAGALEKQRGKVADAERAENSLRGQLEKVNSQLSEQGQKSASAKEKLNTLQTEATTLGNRESELKSKASLASAELGNNATKAQKAAVEQKSLSSQLSVSAERTKNLESQLKQAKSAYGEDSEEVSKLKTQLNEAKTSEQNFKNQLDVTNETIRKQGGFSTQAASNMEKIGTAGTKVSSVGSKLTMGVTTPLLAVGAAAVKTGGSFEAQMNKVGSVTGASTKDFTAMKQEAIDLGQKTVFSASQAATGMENLGSAGFSAKETMKAIPGVLNLAAVSGGDVATASENAASALRGFGLSANQSGHVADVFASAAAHTNAETSDMGEAMKYAAAPAHSLGISLEDTAASVGIMSNAGIKGSQAGTTLRSALLSLANPSKNAAGVIKDLGMKFFDSQGKMKPMSAVIGELRDKTAGMTKEQKASTLATLFGKESVSGMMALVDAGPNKLQKMSDSFKNSGGSAKEMADKMNKGPKASIDAMMGSVESLAIKVTETLSPVIIKATKIMGNMVDVLTNSSPATKKFVIALAGIAAAVGPALFVIGKLLDTVSKIPARIAIVKAIFGGLAPILTNPWTLGIAAVVAAGTLIVTHWSDITKKVGQVWNGMKSGFTTVVNGIANIWKGVQNVFSTVCDAVVSFLKQWGPTILAVLAGPIGLVVKAVVDNWTQIKTKTSEIFNGLVNIIKTVLTNIGAVAKVALMTIESIFSGAWLVISSAAKVAWEALVAVLKAVWQPISGFFKNLWDGVSNVFSSAWNGIKSVVSPIVSAIADVIISGFTNIWNNLKSIMDGIKDVFSTVWNAISSTVKSIVSALASALKPIWDGISNTVKSVWNAIKSFTSSIWNGIKSTLSGIAKSIGSALKSAWDSVKSVASSAWSSVKSTAESKWNSIKSGVSSIAKSLGSALKSAWDSVKSVASSAWGSVKSTAESKWNSIKSSVGSIAGKFGSTIKSAWGSLKGIASSIFGSVASAASSKMNSMKNAFSSGLNAIKGFFSRLHLNLPHIDLPHFSLNGSFSLKPPSVPHLSVNWYAKGGIFTQPTIMPNAQGGLNGYGDAGPEAALPLNAETLGEIGKGIVSAMGNSNNQPIILNVDGRTFASIVGPYVSDYMKQQDATTNFSYGRRFH